MPARALEASMNSFPWILQFLGVFLNRNHQPWPIHTVSYAHFFNYQQRCIRYEIINISCVSFFGAKLKLEMLSLQFYQLVY